MLKTSQVLGLIAFCTYPILFLFGNNYASVSVTQIMLPLLISYSILLLCGITLWLLRLKFRINDDKSFLIVLICTSIFLFYGHLHSYLYNSDIGNLKIGSRNINFGQNRYLLVILSILSGFLITLLIKSKVNKVAYFINVFIFILLAQQTGIIIYEIVKSIIQNKNNTKEQTFIKKTDKYPDIYYIILDGYASNYTLNKSFHYDNSTFENRLTDKGFKFIKNSASNYPYTRLSLTSSLNYEYLGTKKYRYDEDLFYNIKTVK